MDDIKRKRIKNVAKILRNEHITHTHLPSSRASIMHAMTQYWRYVKNYDDTNPSKDIFVYIGNPVGSTEAFIVHSKGITENVSTSMFDNIITNSDSVYMAESQNIKNTFNACTSTEKYNYKIYGFSSEYRKGSIYSVGFFIHNGKLNLFDSRRGEHLKIKKYILLPLENVLGLILYAPMKIKQLTKYYNVYDNDLQDYKDCIEYGNYSVDYALLFIGLCINNNKIKKTINEVFTKDTDAYHENDENIELFIKKSFKKPTINTTLEKEASSVIDEILKNNINNDHMVYTEIIKYYDDSIDNIEIKDTLIYTLKDKIKNPSYPVIPNLSFSVMDNVFDHMEIPQVLDINEFNKIIDINNEIYIPNLIISQLDIFKKIYRKFFCYEQNLEEKNLFKKRLRKYTQIYEFCIDYVPNIYKLEKSKDPYYVNKFKDTLVDDINLSKKTNRKLFFLNATINKLNVLYSDYFDLAVENIIRDNRNPSYSGNNITVFSDVKKYSSENIAEKRLYVFNTELKNEEQIIPNIIKNLCKYIYINSTDLNFKLEEYKKNNCADHLRKLYGTYFSGKSIYAMIEFSIKQLNRKKDISCYNLITGNFEYEKFDPSKISSSTLNVPSDQGQIIDAPQVRTSIQEYFVELEVERKKIKTYIDSIPFKWDLY